MSRSSRCAAAMLLVVSLAAAGGCERKSPVVNDSTTEHNKSLARRWIEHGFNERNLDVVDELFAADFAVNGQVVGVTGLKESMRRHINGFPDLHVTIDTVIAEGNSVGIWYSAEGTHRGEFEAIPPTGKRVKWSGFDLLTIEVGRISAARFLSDHLGLLTQLGATLTLPHQPDRM